MVLAHGAVLSLPFAPSDAPLGERALGSGFFLGFPLALGGATHGEEPSRFRGSLLILLQVDKSGVDGIFATAHIF